MRMAKMKQNGITPRPNQKSLADAFDIKPKELNDFKQQMIHSQPSHPPPIQTQNVIHSNHASRPTSPHKLQMYKRNDSMSYGPNNIHLIAQHSANPLYAHSIQTSNMSMQPNQCFTTPQTTRSQKGSRRNSIYSRRSLAAQQHSLRPPIPPAPQNSVNTSMNPMTAMILMVFQSLPSAQKKELMHSLNVQMKHQPNPAVAAALNPAAFKGVCHDYLLNKKHFCLFDDVNFISDRKAPPTHIGTAKSAQDISIKPTDHKKLKNSVSFSSFRSHAEPKPKPKSAKKPSLQNDSSIVKKLNTMTKTKQLKNRMHSQIHELKIGQPLFDIRESSGTSNSKSNKSKLPTMSDTQNSLSWKQTDNVSLPPTAPLIGGALSTLYSQQDLGDDIEDNSLSDIDSDGILSPNLDNKIAPQLFKEYNPQKKQSPIALLGPSDILSPIQATPIEAASAIPIKLSIVNHESNESCTQTLSEVNEQKQIEVDTPTPNEIDTPRQSVINQIIQNKTDYINQSNNLLTLKPPSSPIQIVSSNSSSDFSTESDADSVPPTPVKSPIVAGIATDSPRKLLLSQGLKKRKQRVDSRSTSLDLEGDEFAIDDYQSNDDEEESDIGTYTKQRLSSADLFALDILSHASAEDFAIESVEKQHTVRFKDSLSTNSDNESSKSEDSVQQPNEYSVQLQKLHPSNYQKQKLESRHDSLTTTDEERELICAGNQSSQRIGVKLESHAIHQASMMDIDMNPYTISDGETEEEDVDYFGGKTPIKVREGTETIQKTLRAVWVRGHTSIGTLIHFILIVINCMAAVMFVAAIEGYKNDEIEYFFTSCFLCDFCVRLYAAKSALRYLRSAKGIADFVSVIPGIILYDIFYSLVIHSY